MIGHAVFRRRKQAELPMKAQDVPRIDRSAAIARSRNPRFGSIVAAIQFAGIDRPMSGRKRQWISHAMRAEAATHIRLPQAAGVTHAGEQPPGARAPAATRTPSQLLIRVLPRLRPAAACRAASARDVRHAGLVEPLNELLVERVAIRGDPGQQRRQRHPNRGIGPVAAGAEAIRIVPASTAAASNSISSRSSSPVLERPAGASASSVTCCDDEPR